MIYNSWNYLEMNMINVCCCCCCCCFDLSLKYWLLLFFTDCYRILYKWYKFFCYTNNIGTIKIIIIIIIMIQIINIIIIIILIIIIIIITKNKWIITTIMISTTKTTTNTNKYHLLQRQQILSPRDLEKNWMGRRDK